MNRRGIAVAMEVSRDPKATARESPAIAWCFAGLAGLVALAAYLATRARTVGFIDRGELAAVACTLGIAHPSGYPTLTLLGHLVARAGGRDPLQALNLFSVVTTALGVVVLARLYEHLAARMRTRGTPAPPASRGAAAALAALLAGFTPTWWQQADGFEAYGLHALLLPLVVWTFVSWLDADDRPTHDGSRARGIRGAVFAFTLGIALTNHLTTAVLAPAFLIAFAARFGWRWPAWRTLLGLLPPFALGLLPYIYLPLRSAAQPRFDWGNPEVAWRFLAHVTGRQYREWMFSDAEGARQQVTYFVSRLPWEWAFGGLVLAAWGAVRLARAPARLAWLCLIAISSVVYASGYSIRDIDAYTMPATLAVGALVALGLVAWSARAGRWALGAGGLLVVASFALHYAESDERPNHLVEDYTRNVLSELPPRAVLVSAQWDYLISACYYLQDVRGLRRDVTVVNPELMGRSWYVDELRRRDPDLVRRFESAARRFEKEVEPFERGRPCDAAVIRSAYEAMLTGFVNAAQDDRRLFVTWEVGESPWKRWVRVPMGLSAELRADSAYVPLEPPSYTYRPWPGRRDVYTATMARNYGQPLAERMLYEAAHGHPDRARRFAALAASFDPGWRSHQVPVLPLDGRQLVAEALAFFERLRVSAPGS